MKIFKKVLITIVSLLIFTLFASLRGLFPAVNSSVPAGYTLDSASDIVSIKDLYISGSKGQTILERFGNNDVTYDKTNNNGSLIFKFYYEVNDESNSENVAIRIHFDVADDKWNDDCVLWIRGDGIHMKKYSNSTFSYSANSALSLGLHKIEFGRVALMNGQTASGNYYVYYKVDDVLCSDTTAPYNNSKIGNSMFFNFSGQSSNIIYDIDTEFQTYETATNISVNDLRVKNAPVSNSIVFDEAKSFTYESSNSYGSVSFKFKYEIIDPSKLSCQFHFNSSYLDNNNGAIWFKYDAIRICKGGADYLVYNWTPEAGIYNIEIGKLYNQYGEYQGMYTIYICVDDVKILEYNIASLPNNSSIYTTGSDNNVIYDINYIPIVTESSLYINTWDVTKSGLQFNAKINKYFINANKISDAGFILTPTDFSTPGMYLRGSLNLEGNYYTLKAALVNIASYNITRRYNVKFYYVSDGQFICSDGFTTSLYEKLNDLSGYSQTVISKLNKIKSKVLNISLNQTTLASPEASVVGNKNTANITLTPNKAGYTSFLLNGSPIYNNVEVKIGYYSYLVSINNGVVNMTKNGRIMMYGGSEHFVETNSGHDTDMTAKNLSPMAKQLGLSTIRLDISLFKLFTVNPDNSLSVNSSYKKAIEGVIKELKTNGGVTDFLAVFWTLQPSEFVKNYSGKPWAEKTAPNPQTQSDIYLKWLQINGEAAKQAALLFPDITNFEAWNEPEMMCESDGPLSKQDGTNYSVSEKARILSDLCYYYNKGIKEANPNNILTSPSLCCAQRTDSDFDCSSPEFLRAIYECIADNTPVPGFSTADKNADNYFQVINIHPYLGRGTTINNFVSFVNSFTNVASDYNDGETEIWITEFGFAQNKESNAINLMLDVIDYANSIENVTRFYFYKVHDYTSKIDNDNWGLYYYDCSIKDIGLAVLNKINPAKDDE